MIDMKAKQQVPKGTIKTFTIGFTQKTAQEFFEKLRAAGVKRVVDVRLHNARNLAGFTKSSHLPYFLRQILDGDYVHEPLLAPTEQILQSKRDGGSWSDRERDFLALMEERQVENKIDPQLLDGGCLLCSEPEPDECHRRLVAEYLQRHWGNLSISHLV